MIKLLIFIILLPNILFAFNKDYCIAKNKKDRIIGLTKFDTNEEFIKNCNGVMIFIYKKDICRIFTMKKMKFNVFIKDKFENKLFKTDESKKVCGKTIIESSTSLNQE